MRKAACFIALTSILLVHSGCSNGPLARMIRGGSCDSCTASPATTYPGAFATETSGCATCVNGAQPNMWNGQSAVGAAGPIVGADINGAFGGQVVPYNGFNPGPANQ